MDTFCTKLNEMSELKLAIAQSIKTGKGPDGKPINVAEAKDNLPFFNAIVDACQNPTPSSIRRVVEIMTDKKIKTCKVLNDYSRMEFRWNEATKSWISQEGPSGPCGTVSIGTLERDKSSNSQFWLYTEKKIRTNPSGALPGGLSCGQFPEYTLHYTWRANMNFQQCTYIQNMMN